MKSLGALPNIILVTVGLFTTSVLADQREQECIDRSTMLVQKLACINGLTVNSIRTDVIPDAQVVEMSYEQPVDHQNPFGAKFMQKLVLIHRSELQPMVLQTSGYSIFVIRRSVLATKFDTNQLQVEHRYFSNSRPAELDWSKLNIKESAYDFHRITLAFKQIYKKRWVNTGGSKGGMTSLYHRFFFPNDLDGTLADVAPHSYSTDDQRYVDFVRDVGGDAYRECREKLKKWQVGLLNNRDTIVPTIPGNFTQLGSADVAFEHATIEAPFFFWQYGNPDGDQGCSAIPDNGTASEMYDYLNKIAELSSYADEDLERFVPYYFQAATQLGNPGNLTSHLEIFRRHRFVIDQYTPKNLNYTYSNSSMRDVTAWLQNSGTGIMFVYGGFDPWTAGQFSVGPNAVDVYKFTVAKGNHGSNISQLSPEDQTRALNILSRWLDKAPLPAVGTEDSLDAYEFEYRRKHHL